MKERLAHPGKIVSASKPRDGNFLITASYTSVFLIGDLGEEVRKPLRVGRLKRPTYMRLWEGKGSVSRRWPLRLRRSGPTPPQSVWGSFLPSLSVDLL